MLNTITTQMSKRTLKNFATDGKFARDTVFTHVGISPRTPKSTLDYALKASSTMRLPNYEDNMSTGSKQGRTQDSQRRDNGRT